jgi:hypothetical protein
MTRSFTVTDWYKIEGHHFEHHGGDVHVSHDPVPAHKITLIHKAEDNVSSLPARASTRVTCCRATSLT